MPKYYKMNRERLEEMRMIAWLLECEAKYVQQACPNTPCGPTAQATLQDSDEQGIPSTGLYLEGLAGLLFKYIIMIRDGE